MKARIQKITGNATFQSLLFGLLFTGLIITVWDIPIQKFIIQIDPFEKTNQEETLWFIDDFNGDGNSERLRCFNGYDSESLDIVHYDKNGNLMEHFHYRASTWTHRLKPKIIDINEDGIKELLFFSLRNDSIFLNAINLSDFSLTIDHHYFNTFETKKDIYACHSEFFEFGDFDKTGTNELFFTFDAGFGLYPRGVFKVEFPSLKISSSPTDYMLINSISFCDFNEDGIPEIITSTSAPDNSSNKNKYSDTCSYITALDYELNFLFEPIPMNGRYSYTYCIPQVGKEILLYAVHYSRSDSKEPIRIMVLNDQGQIINQKRWYNIRNPENFAVWIRTINKQPYLIIKNVGRFRLTKELDLLPNDLSIVENNKLSLLNFDFNEDGIEESIFYNSRQKITVYNEISEEEITFDSPVTIRDGLVIYPYLENGKTKRHAITTRGGFFFLEYHRNKNYYLLFLIYMALFVAITSSVRALFYFQKQNIEKKWNTEKQLSELQFNAVKNQLNPHFLFNALNSVAYMINAGKKDEAYDFLAINSRMIQRVMNDSKEVKRSLKDELQFTKDYVSIQKHRFKERFDAEFDVHPDVDLKLEVPKMCIHTYVENAIKHGFRNTKSAGLLKIEIEPFQKHGVSIAVIDNGMGRKAASEYKDSSGNGLNIMNDFYHLFEKYHGYKIDISIGDNEPVGTVVELKIEISHTRK